MRKYYQRRLPGDPSKDYYFIQRLTGKTQPVLIEYGFIDNDRDLNKLKNNLFNYGEAVVRAVANYTGTKYTPPATSGDSYVVQRGDTLYSIANKFGTTVNELKSANNLTSNLLNVGQTLIIPSTTPSESDEYVIYTVQRGDSLYSIANEFDVTVNDIVSYNNLSTTSLSIGQKLLIPISKTEKPTEQQYYVVQKNDSLYSIARKFDTTVDELIKLNNLTTTILQIGDKLLISGSPSNAEKPTNNTYTVKSGDSLYSIAKRYNTTIDELKRINNLSSNLLSIGQTLLLPNGNNNVTDSDTNAYITYIVQRGDNLYNIARDYNTTVSEIKRINNLSTDLLSIGQTLLLPA